MLSLRPHAVFLVSRLRALLSLCGLVLAVSGAEPRKQLPATPDVRPLPGLVAWAAAENIPVSGIAPLRDEGAVARAGDTVVALVSLVEKQKPLRQWLLTIESAELSPEERALQPPQGATMHTSTGLKVRFESERQALALRLAGPFFGDERAGKSLADKRSRVLVKADFLGLGLDRTAQFLLRLQSSKLNYQASSSPFSAERVAKGKAEAAAAGLTQAEEEAFAGFPVAMLAFFNIAQRTPGLEEILYELISKASVAWSMVKNGGRWSPSFETSSGGTAAIPLQRWDLPAPGYIFPVQVTLNNKPLLHCAFTVTAPKPPLRTSAGVLELFARSTAYPEKVLIMRVLSARSGPEATAPRIE